jgi:hypothetical protein
MDHDHQIQSWAQDKLRGSKNGSELALEAIPHDGSLQAPPRPNTDMGRRLFAGQRTDGEQGPARPMPLSVNGFEGFGMLQGSCAWCSDCNGLRPE